MGVHSPIWPLWSGRHWSAIRHGVLERRSPTGADRRVEPSWRVPQVRFGLAHAEEDPVPRRAAGLPAERAAAQAEAGTVPADRSPDSQGRSAGAEEATAHSKTDLRAAARRARLSGRPHRGEGRRAGLEAIAPRSLSAALASIRGSPGRLR